MGNFSKIHKLFTIKLLTDGTNRGIMIKLLEKSKYKDASVLELADRHV